MSKITKDGLNRSGTGRFIVVPIWQRWAVSVNGWSVYLYDAHYGTEEPQ